MKKLCSFFVFYLAFIHLIFAGGGCVIDSANTRFFYPAPDSLPCIERNVAYGEVIQIAVPQTINLQDFGAPFPFILTVDSVVITGVNGLPNGIAYSPNPANGVLYGGERGCALVYGTTSDPSGRYPVTFNGTFTAHGMPFPPFFDGDTTLDMATLQNLSQGMFDMYVDVIEQGAACRPFSDISDFQISGNEISVCPNPNNGSFRLTIESKNRMPSEIEISDLTGRAIYSQLMGQESPTSFINLDRVSKGLYTIQLKTPNGFTSKLVSIE